VILCEAFGRHLVGDREYRYGSVTKTPHPQCDGDIPRPAAAFDERGTFLGVESFATTEVGYKKLLGSLSDFGAVELVGVEGTGSYGPGLTGQWL